MFSREKRFAPLRGDFGFISAYRFRRLAAPCEIMLCFVERGESGKKTVSVATLLRRFFEEKRIYTIFFEAVFSPACFVISAFTKTGKNPPPPTGRTAARKIFRAYTARPRLTPLSGLLRQIFIFPVFVSRKTNCAPARACAFCRSSFSALLCRVRRRRGRQRSFARGSYDPDRIGKRESAANER